MVGFGCCMSSLDFVGVQLLHRHLVFARLVLVGSVYAY